MHTISELGQMVKELDNLVRNGQFRLVKEKCKEIYGAASIAETERLRTEGNQMVLAVLLPGR